MEIPELLTVPAATFKMGNNEQRRDEQPTRFVTLAAFRAARTPVTNAQYDEFVSATARPVSEFRSDPGLSGLNQPVVGVSWHDATAYCEWLSSEAGINYRLPTEAEREYAALGGESGGSDWPWGSVPPDERPELAAISKLEQPHEPSTVCSNGYGLRCMAENVHEWCSDWYARDTYATAHSLLPGGPQSGTRKVCRGGSWRHSVKFTRVSARASLDPEFRYNDFGFRVYADAESDV